jgi:hypothetical protein
LALAKYKKQARSLTMQKNYSIGAIRLFVFTVATTLLVACSTGPKIFINEDPGGKFDSYKTYNYEEILSTDDRPGYRSILSQYLINAVDKELAARGYTKSDTPDLTINFNLATQEKIRSTSSPRAGGYYGYRGYGAYGGYDTTVTQYTEGTFNVDMIDNTSAQKQLVWEGVAVGRMTDKARANLEEATNTLMAEIFSRYPYVAPGYVPPVAEEDTTT